MISLRGLVAVGMTWLCGAGMTALAALQVASETGELLVAVCVGSGLIALAAGLPGALLEAFRKRPVEAAVNNVAPVTTGFFVGVLIRLVGTVALAALCRYQLPAAGEQIAAAILIWYVSLTATEVITLAHALSKRDSLVSPGHKFADSTRSKVNPSVQ
ncbi:hypothetical protein C2E31_24235 [Rhodopirellula baltica]|nr:hypothetical protein C2E31_24235 [Rhodopirellula baltica]